MKCPLSAKIDYQVDGKLHTNWEKCLEEECAWYFPLSSCCAVRDFPGILIAAGNVLGNIHVEMCLSKRIYRCHYCGMEIVRTARAEGSAPARWIRSEQVDGRFVWICDMCRDEGRS